MTTTAIGPVQLIVFAFDQPHFGGGIAEQLRQLKDHDLVRVVDALIVHKNAEGELRTLQVTDLTPSEIEAAGAIIGGLIGLGAAGAPGMEAGAQAGQEITRERGDHLFDASEAWDVLEDIPVDTAAALVLLEHRWAIPLRDAILAEGGEAIGDIWLTPDDLIAAGLMSS